MNILGTHKQRILVAGATGYLGGYVVKELHKRGCYVRTLARSPQKLEPIRDEIDDCFTGEVTRPDTLNGVCEGMDVVFSSIGITRQKDGLTFRDVDYKGNINLLQEALKAGVKKFIYVSVFNGHRLHHLDIVAAHEDFIGELKASGIDYVIVRPTGYYSDIEEILQMACKGKVWLVGTGENLVNPIHGADLAKVCADAIEGSKQEIEVGGPDIMSWNEIASLAFAVSGRSQRIRHVSKGVIWVFVWMMRIINRHQGELLAFFTTMMTHDNVAPTTGTHSLEAYYRSLGAIQ